MHTLMHTLRRPRPARLLAAARAGVLSLLLAAGAGGGTASAADDIGLGPMQPGGRPITGSQPFVNILCKFPDKPDEPQTAAGLRTVFGIDSQGRTAGSAYPTVDRYWREVSYNTINPYAGIDLDRSRVVGWVTLPAAERSYQQQDANGNPIPVRDGAYKFDLYRLRDACIAAAEAQVVNPDGTRGVNFNNFKGVNLFFNGQLEDASHGAPNDLTLDNTRRYGLPVTWINADGARNHKTIAHEMGHGFGLNHSSGPYQATKDSAWDAMSGGQHCFPGAEFLQQGFGCVGVHTIAAHKAYLGWLPAARRYDAKPGPATTITLSRLAQPVTTSGVYWMAKLPIPGKASQYYTVELRTRVGYDRGVPEGVVLHKVDEARDSRNAQVVDPDNDGFLGARTPLLAGQVFADAATGVSVRVESLDLAAGTARVTVGVTPLLSIDDVTVREPAPPPAPTTPDPEPEPSPPVSPARFTVRIPAPATAPVTVSYATAPGTAKAGAGQDYLHKAGTVTIPAGATSATVTVDVLRDRLDEPAETFFVNLSSPVNGTLADGQGKGTILGFA
jgi:M6 family metalloprotease-like protein